MTVASSQFQYILQRMAEHGVGGQNQLGLMRGEVNSNDDPEKRARVQVRIVQVHGTGVNEGEVSADLLPWAEPCFPMSGFADGGMVHVPPVGATVWCAFENGDPHRPVYLGGWWKTGELPSEVTDPDKQRVVKTPAGHTFLLDDENDGIIRLSHFDGDREIILDGNAKTTTVKNKSGQTIVLDEPTKTITVTNDSQTVTIDGTSQTITIDNGGTQTATMNAPSQTVEITNATQQVVMNAASQTINVQNGPLQTFLLNALLQQVVLTNGPLQVVTLDGLLQTILILNGIMQVLMNGILGKAQVNTLTVDGIELGTGAAAETYGVFCGEDFKTLFEDHYHTSPAGGVTGLAKDSGHTVTPGVHTSLIVKAKVSP